MPQNGGHADEINIFMNIVEYFPLRLTCEVQFRVFGTGFLLHWFQNNVLSTPKQNLMDKVNRYLLYFTHSDFFPEILFTYRKRGKSTSFIPYDII